MVTKLWRSERGVCVCVGGGGGGGAGGEVDGGGAEDGGGGGCRGPTNDSVVIVTVWFVDQRLIIKEFGRTALPLRPPSYAQGKGDRPDFYNAVLQTTAKDPAFARCVDWSE